MVEISKLQVRKSVLKKERSATLCGAHIKACVIMSALRNALCLQVWRLQCCSLLAMGPGAFVLFHVHHPHHLYKQNILSAFCQHSRPHEGPKSSVQDPTFIYVDVIRHHLEKFLAVHEIISHNLISPSGFLSSSQSPSLHLTSHQ